MAFTQDQLRSTLSMFRVGTGPRPPFDKFRGQDLAAASLLGFAHTRDLRSLLPIRGEEDDCHNAAYASNARLCFNGCGALPCPYGQWAGAFNAIRCEILDLVEPVRQLCNPSTQVQQEDPTRPSRVPTHLDRYRPIVVITYADDNSPEAAEGAMYTDAEGSSAAFCIRDHWRYYLRDTQLKYDPCTKDPREGGYCGRSDPPFDPPIWIMRVHTQNAAGRASWEMFCDSTIQLPECDYYADTEEEWLDQTVPRDLPVRLLNIRGASVLSYGYARAPVFFRFRIGRGPCFAFEDSYCYTEGCFRDDPHGGGGDRVWGCIENGGWSGGGGPGHPSITDQVKGALTGLLARAAIATIGINNGPNTDVDPPRIESEPGGRYPHANADDLVIKNICWTAVAHEFLDMHGEGEGVFFRSGGRYDVPGLSNWRVGVGTRFDDRFIRVVALVEPKLGLELGAELHIHGTAGTTGQSGLDGNAVINVEGRRMYAEDMSRTFIGRRAFAAIHLDLTVAPKRTATTDSQLASAGFSFLTSLTTDPYDLRIKHPTEATEHPQLKLLATGPTGGRIPYLMSWDGLHAVSPYSIGEEDVPGEFDASGLRQFERYVETCITRHDQDVGARDDAACCGMIRAIDGLVVFGEVNDHANPDGYQVMVGGIQFSVNPLGNQDCACSES